MSGFRTIAGSAGEPLRVVVVGAGGMGRAWLRAVDASADVELAGIADIDLDAARAAADGCGSPDVPVSADAVGLARSARADALINVTVPEAHHAVTTAALFAGLPVLGEKPVAPTVAQALSLAAAAETTGELFMVSQSRRWNPQLSRLRAMTRQLGAIGTVTTEFFKAPRFGGFRDRMDQPLLVDMAIHPFDSVRFVLTAEPVSVYCHTFNPPWSWYAGDANATAVFEMSNGTRFVYAGSWCSPGAETSWNGSWRVSGERGTALWSGDDEPVLDAPEAGTPDPPEPWSGIGGALELFVRALRTGETPSGEVHENIMSLAMVEAAVESARSGQPCRLADVLARAHEQAVRDEQRDTVRDRLAGWPSVHDALSAAGAPPTDLGAVSA